MIVNQMKKIFFIVVFMISWGFSATAQNFNLSKFTNVQGLPQNYVYSVVQDRYGFIWIGLAEGLSKYDGTKFTNYTVRDSLSDNFVSAMLIDTDGNLWCGHGNGQFSVFRNSEFHRVHVADVASPIKDMCIDDRGGVWAVEQNKGIVYIDPDGTVTTHFDREKFGRRIYYSIKAVNSMTLLVGTSDGVMLVKFSPSGELLDPEDIADLPSSAVNCIVKSRNEGEYLMGTEDGEIYRYSLVNGATLIERCTESCSSNDESYNIKTIYETAEGNLYIATWGQGLKEWAYSEETKKYTEVLSLTENNGLDNNYVSSITCDREGIFWFGTYGAGVVAWINNYFAQYDLTNIGFQRSKIVSAAVDDKSLWMGLNSGLIRMDKQCMDNFEFFDASMGLPSDLAITAICFDKKRGVQYLGTDRDGIYTCKKGTRYFRKMSYECSSRTSEMVNGIVVDEDHLYIASQGGFISYDLNTSASRCYTTLDGLPHNNINFVYMDAEGQVWIGPKDSGIALFLGDEGFEIHRLSDVPVDVAGMAVDERDRLWLATVNNGVICSSNDSIVSISTADGMEKNYCYGIASDGNDRMWICHQPGLSCIDLNSGNIRTFNNTNGINHEFNGVVEENGDLWFSSSTGVVHYNSEFDRRSVVAPIINLTKVVISNHRHNLKEPIDLPYPYDGALQRLEFDFVGICMKDPQNVRYEFWLQLDGNENEVWTPLGTQNHKEFEWLPDGDHVLHVRAFNSDGVVCSKPLEIPIHIDSPFWKSIFFPIFILGLLYVIIRVVTEWREEKLRQRQKELEDEVSRQTVTLREQKGEIEQKNKDILDSINYAKRIQTAILPSVNSLNDYPFADSFVLYLPKDIVSGDFYWHMGYDNRILICCGDCTGHGVPGAFMSMIGATLLNDASRDEELRSHPSKMLERLDKEIKATLNKNQSIEAQDGMDCAVIEIDFDTLELRSAAARRPVQIFSHGKLNEIRGTRRGVGEHRNSNEFNETTTQLQKGDVIYLSSDGFASQFGGDTSDKSPYTAGALKRFLEAMVDEPMNIQKEKLNNEFSRWKGSCEQIDDVVIMGLKI